MKLAHCAALGAAIAASTFASRAQAESPSETTAADAPLEVAPRIWLYLDDATLPAAMHALAFARATYTRDESPTFPFGRPFVANISRPGGVVEAGGEVGLLPRLSLAASGFGGGDLLGFGALAGLRFEPFQGARTSTHLVFSGGYLHELNGGDGGWARVSLAQDVGRLRLGATVHGEHVFAGGRDPVDLLVMAGASYAVTGPLRAGIEYVAQDLEEAADDGAEGGTRQFLGPTLALELMGRHLSIVAGPALGIGPQSPAHSGRMSLAYEY